MKEQKEEGKGGRFLLCAMLGAEQGCAYARRLQMGKQVEPMEQHRACGI